MSRSEHPRHRRAAEEDAAAEDVRSAEEHAVADESAAQAANSGELPRTDPDHSGRRPESRDEEISRLRQEVDQANKRALQSQAEAENFRKRLRRDADEQAKFAALPLVADMLEVRDNLRRAIEAADTGQPVSGLRDGVAMCAKQLDDVFAKYGVREIPSQGEPFDPNVHEAISQIPSPDHEPGTVAHVATVGFTMHDRVIRPSQVVVSSGGGE